MFPGKGVGRKFSREGGQRKKDLKNSKKKKNSTRASSRGGQRKNRPQNSKKRPKMALLSLYLLYQYHV